MASLAPIQPGGPLPSALMNAIVDKVIELDRTITNSLEDVTRCGTGT
jgi:hypothetical protein